MAASLKPTIDKSSTAFEAISKSATTEHASTAPSSNPEPEPEPELDFQGDVLVSNDIPTQADLDKCADLLVLDAQGTSRPFRTLYTGEGVAPRQLIIFVRHFFCGVSILFLMPYGMGGLDARVSSRNCSGILRPRLRARRAPHGI